MNRQTLRELIYKQILELSHEEGINASGREEIYGCIFGRDSAITILKLLRVNEKRHSPQLLEISRRALLNLVTLQGKEFNPQSGEEPGKFIHEFRKEGFDHLIKNNWFVYPDGTLKNYDSIDSTPLTLIALYRYFETTQDTEFLNEVLPAVERGLNWIITFGDKDKDYLIEYEIPEGRTCTGLVVHSWTDSHESLLQIDGKMPGYPISPVEAQGYAWLALKLWADYYAQTSPQFARKLLLQAENLKKVFNKLFLFKDHDYYFLSQALDGLKKQINTVTGNPLIALWASYNHNGLLESVIDEKYLLDIVKRAFEPDLFDPAAGIRTMSTKSLTFNPSENSYHNGSFWPVLNGLIQEGLEKWDLYAEATLLKEASIKPIEFFGTPIELYIKSSDGMLLEYKNISGQVGCKTQAWTAAAALDWLTED
ncbi:MAG: Amylo-alpha-16-glucosidase [Candidatus Daviesbacteria bacterium GW2011_GWA2_38_24]|uniref:Amylo-alpha-16-glucosidase n=1 Tax=Candidatus Daviesbacteria bacterium GW2011_GWA2_38_24 TaxID=1618422 RepID=A0A0G0JQA3_9BACT|nr:MAG: Amylo-alpha-16-glucosidase [Candidatus Daviesbacteria bacterium GW2011_GWA2_38_24]KKQ79137.1 MAG: Amylo-alpha-16-glucosidase [Candidatus Daviesbacteria bacterium GW2011_GWA1_38_7]